MLFFLLSLSLRAVKKGPRSPTTAECQKILVKYFCVYVLFSCVNSSRNRCFDKFHLVFFFLV